MRYNTIYVGCFDGRVDLLCIKMLSLLYSNYKYYMQQNSKNNIYSPFLSNQNVDVAFFNELELIAENIYREFNCPKISLNDVKDIFTSFVALSGLEYDIINIVNKVEGCGVPIEDPIVISGKITSEQEAQLARLFPMFNFTFQDNG